MENGSFFNISFDVELLSRIPSAIFASRKKHTKRAFSPLKSKESLCRPLASPQPVLLRAPTFRLNVLDRRVSYCHLRENALRDGN